VLPLIENPDLLPLEDGLADEEVTHGSRKETAERCIVGLCFPLIVNAQTTCSVRDVDVVVGKRFNRVADLLDLGFGNRVVAVISNFDGKAVQRLSLGDKTKGASGHEFFVAEG